MRCLNTCRPALPFVTTAAATPAYYKGPKPTAAAHCQIELRTAYPKLNSKKKLQLDPGLLISSPRPA